MSTREAEFQTKDINFKEYMQTFNITMMNQQNQLSKIEQRFKKLKELNHHGNATRNGRTEVEKKLRFETESD